MKAVVLTTASLFVLLLGAVALELMFGQWLKADAWNKTLKLNIIRDMIVQYPVKALYDSPSGQVTYTRDMYGLRGDYRSPRDISILTVGGSTTDQRYVDDADTWQAVLQKNLRSSGKTYTVANAGVDGHSTFAHLESFRLWFPLIPMKPKYVLFYVGSNDLFKDGQSIYDFDPSQKPKTDWVSIAEENSAFYRAYQLAMGIRNVSNGISGHERIPIVWDATKPVHAPDMAKITERYQRFGDRVASLVQVTKGTGATPICVTVPSGWYTIRQGKVIGMSFETTVQGETLNGVDISYHKEAINNELKKRCQQAGVPVVDLAAQPWEEGDFYDPSHTNPKGAKKVGERLAASLSTILP